MTRPVLLDLFCGAGGAAMGYHRAGFDVIGVDAADQPRYPFEWYKGDALDLLPELIDRYRPASIHASPPCQDHSPLSALAGKHGTGWLLDATRRALARTGVPYVIENVAGADMPGALVLCGSEFALAATDQDGRTRWLKRHRQFESNVFLFGAGGCNCRGRRIGGVFGTGSTARGGPPDATGYQLASGPARDILRVPWMNRYETSQAIPPVYTEFIGAQLLAHLLAEVPA